MADDPLEALTVQFVEAGVVVVEELGKVVLAHSSAWATVVYLSRERKKGTDTFGPPRVMLRRYKKRGGRFITDKHFTLTTAAQAEGLVGAIAGWFADDGAARKLLDEAGSQHDGEQDGDDT